MQKCLQERLQAELIAGGTLDLILPDQPNRTVRTRMLRGVGGTP